MAQRRPSWFKRNPNLKKKHVSEDEGPKLHPQWMKMCTAWTQYVRAYLDLCEHPHSSRVEVLAKWLDVWKDDPTGELNIWAAWHGEGIWSETCDHPEELSLWLKSHLWIHGLHGDQFTSEKNRIWSVPQNREGLRACINSLKKAIKYASGHRVADKALFLQTHLWEQVQSAEGAQVLWEEKVPVSGSEVQSVWLSNIWFIRMYGTNISHELLRIEEKKARLSLIQWLHQNMPCQTSQVIYAFLYVLHAYLEFKESLKKSVVSDEIRDAFYPLLQDYEKVLGALFGDFKEHWIENQEHMGFEMHQPIWMYTIRVGKLPWGHTLLLIKSESMWDWCLEHGLDVTKVDEAGLDMWQWWSVMMCHHPQTLEVSLMNARRQAWRPMWEAYAQKQKLQQLASHEFAWPSITDKTTPPPRRQRI